ncbi:MAG: amino acid adenylation domain-containing protein, partial [Verrucomicrobia bacterium]|nr:amino acid adenylation domain-containing protein [Verrucomicrobiota bacterium]
MIAEKEIASRRAEFSAEKQALLEKRLRGMRNGEDRPPMIPRRAGGGAAWLSFAQQRLWFLDQLEPGSPLYTMPLAVRLSGRLDRDALERSIAAIVARHEMLRTQFVSNDGVPTQVVVAPQSVELPVIDLAQRPIEEREEELHRLLGVEAQRPFDLARDLMVRARLFRLAEQEHVLFLNMHHIASDGWSWAVFFKELAAFYDAFSFGRAVSLPELPIQYADYAVWQRDHLDVERFEKHLAYWKQQLADSPSLLELPTDRPRPAVQSFRGARQSLALPRSLLDGLKALSRSEGATLCMTLLATFKVLLHRYTRQDDLVVGCPVAGRTQSETEALIGFFVNTLALRGNLAGDPTFHELLQRERQVMIEACAHQDLPFERLAEELRPTRSSSYPPLIQTMFVLQNAPEPNLELPGLDVTPLAVDNGTAKFDLTLFTEESRRGLTATAEYNTDLFDAETIARALQHYKILLESVVADTRQKLSELPLLTADERHQLLVEWNRTETDYPREKTISQLFEEQAEKTPDVVAVVFGEQQLTYRELNKRANRLAHYLQNFGVGPDVMVGVCLERSLEMIIALLGTLKAGGAYVSLDTTYPKERLALMLEDVRAPVLLTEEKFRTSLAFDEKAGSNSKIASPILICVDTNRDTIARESPANPVSLAVAESLAYVSFTSGSTGRPKGVCVPHRGVVRLVRETNYAQFSADEIFLQLAPVAFDASTFEIWGPLLNGARLVVFPPRTPSLAELGEFILINKITTLWLTAGLFHQMVEEQLDSLQNVRQLLSGGDVLSPPHVQKVLAHLPGCRLINGYGPTENTTFTCCHRLTAPLAQQRSIPIGRPISNTQAYVLDEHLRPVPVGVPGELYTGGDGLARGYLNQPELTAERFIPNPFNHESGALLYKTGDLVRWLKDGTIEFLGRADSQVKIRGFRVELGEIETVLTRHPAVKESAVVTCQDAGGEKRLVACLVAKQSPAPAVSELRSFIQAKLPDYMNPTAFIFMDALPLSPNGKVDRRALPPAEQMRPVSEKKYLAPRNAMELRLASMWEEMLGLRPIGVTDQFFELGGHSLMAVRLIAQIEKAFNKRIPVAAIFQSSTVEQLAKLLREEKTLHNSSAFSIVEIQPNGSKPPLFMVHGVGGGMFWGYTNLSRHLGLDQPVYAFKSCGTDGLAEFASIEKMAAHYVADLRMFQPCGPYCLGGYCFGGNVAYEMARQLEAQGEKVAVLALMNCVPPNSSYNRVRWTPAFCFEFLKNLVYWLRYLAQLKSDQQRAFVCWKARVLRRKLLHLFSRSHAASECADVDEQVDLSTQPADRRSL